MLIDVAVVELTIPHHSACTVITLNRSGSPKVLISQGILTEDAVLNINGGGTTGNDFVAPPRSVSRPHPIVMDHFRRRTRHELTLVNQSRSVPSHFNQNRLRGGTIIKSAVVHPIWSGS